jgi:hypothetical protein
MSGLEELLANATPGPWSSGGWAVYRGERFTDSHEPVASVHGDTEATATLIALAPDLARLVLDMGDLYVGILHDLDNGDDPGRGQKDAARALLARLDGLAADARRLAEVLSAREEGTHYDHEMHQWVGQCPHGDVCTGCDARGYCTREEGADA